MSAGLAVAQQLSAGTRVRVIDRHVLGTVIAIATYSDCALVRADNGIERWLSSVLLQPITDHDQRIRA